MNTLRLLVVAFVSTFLYSGVDEKNILFYYILMQLFLSDHVMRSAGEGSGALYCLFPRAPENVVSASD